MLIKVFSVFDVKAGCFGVPFFMQSVGLAVRAFTELVNDPKSSVNKYPGDFTLYQVGEFDDVKGELLPTKHLTNLGLASEFVRQVPAGPVLPGMEKVFETEKRPMPANGSAVELPLGGGR